MQGFYRFVSVKMVNFNGVVEFGVTHTHWGSGRISGIFNFFKIGFISEESLWLFYTLREERMKTWFCMIFFLFLRLWESLGQAEMR